jgi:hypothetical protein
MRPAAMPARFGEALEAVAAASERNADAKGRDIQRQVAAMKGTVASWCERLDASPAPRALQAAREQGEELDDDWATALRETLAALLEESYVAGG